MARSKEPVIEPEDETVNPSPVHVADLKMKATMDEETFEAKLQDAYEKGKAEVMAELARVNAVLKGMATAAEKSLKGDETAVINEFHKIVREWHSEMAQGSTLFKEKADALLVKLGLMK
jgi:hypothetical protein